jgi:hypothetical protein
MGGLCRGQPNHRAADRRGFRITAIAEGSAVPPTVWAQPASNRANDGVPASQRIEGYFFDLSLAASDDSAATKASCGTSTRPIVFIRFLPSFCFSSSLRLRVMSPP